jgi:hypothetical protein
MVTPTTGIALAVCWVAFDALTVHRLFRSPVNERERFVLRLGVKGWGIGTWLVFSAIAPILIPDIAAAGYGWTVVGLAFFGFPLWLSGGWCVGRAWAAMLGIRPDQT